MNWRRSADADKSPFVIKARDRPLFDALCNLWQVLDHKRRLSEKDVNKCGLCLCALRRVLDTESKFLRR
jgi:hypothetical protein